MNNSPANTDSKEQVFEELRHLMAEQASRRDQHSRSPIGVFREYVGLGTECVSDLLESRFIVSLAGCLSLVFVVSLWMMLPDRSRELSLDLTTFTEADQAFADQGTRVQGVGDSDQSSSSRTGQAFIIRVGTFRDASNAKRVADRLQKQMLDAKTGIIDSGLYVVTVGPFSQKEAAEKVARSVQDAIGLAPTILRRD